MAYQNWDTRYEEPEMMPNALDDPEQLGLHPATRDPLKVAAKAMQDWAGTPIKGDRFWHELARVAIEAYEGS